MRKCLCPSEPGIDDEGASHKLQAVGTAPHMTNHHMLRVQTSAPLTPASGSTDEGEFRQVRSKTQKCQQRSALPPGLAGKNAPPPRTKLTVPPVARAPASCSSHAPCLLRLPAAAPAFTAGAPATSVPAPPPTTSIVLFRPAHNDAAFPCTCCLAIARAGALRALQINSKNIVAVDTASPEWTECLLDTSEIAGMYVNVHLPADRS